MKKILLDTNMLIYREDNKILDKDISELTRNLYDSSEYKIVSHPKSMEEAEKNKNIEQRRIFISKIKSYPQIDMPPKPTLEFIQIVGRNNENDDIDNELLFAVKQNCVAYFITNDIKLKNKSRLIGLEDRVLTIKEALDLFKVEEQDAVETLPCLKLQYLRNLNLDDEFFDSLRNDYEGFDNWFLIKRDKEAKAYVAEKNGKISAFLMLKEEGEEEDYSEFSRPFLPAKRLKVATLKVAERGKRIGEACIKTMIKEAFLKNVDEIYVTTFPKQDKLIELLKEYGFYESTYKLTKHSDGSEDPELVYVKDMKNKSEFPYVTYAGQKVFIVPIIPKYHRLLFPEVKPYQCGIEDINGGNSSGNAIKKVYITNGAQRQFTKGDILFFYASEEKKAITAVGVVDYSFHPHNIEETKKMIKSITAYDENELRKNLKTTSTVIVFKHCLTLENPIDYNLLKVNNVSDSNFPSTTPISKEGVKNLLKLCGNDINNFNIVS